MSKLFDELAAMKKAYDKKLKEEGEAAIKELFKEFFEKHPKAQSITWTQYTPYWNDGDACYFRVNEMYLQLEGEEDEDYYNGWDPYGLKKEKDPEMKAMGKDFEEVESSLPEDVMEHVFGDHVKIVATREGFKVHDYEHD